MRKPTRQHGAIAFLQETIDRQRAALEAVLPILERGNASYHRINQAKADCPTLGPLVAQVRAALAATQVPA